MTTDVLVWWIYNNNKWYNMSKMGLQFVWLHVALDHDAMSKYVLLGNSRLSVCVVRWDWKGENELRERAIIFKLLVAKYNIMATSKLSLRPDKMSNLVANSSILKQHAIQIASQQKKYHIIVLVLVLVVSNAIAISLIFVQHSCILNIISAL